MISIAASKAPATAASASQVAAEAALAEVVARDFLAGTGTQVAAASGVDKSLGTVSGGKPVGLKYETLAYAGTTQMAGPGGATWNVNHFTVSVSGKLLDLAVTTTSTTDGPVLITYPSIIPLTMPDASFSKLSFESDPNAVDAKEVQKLTVPLTTWAKAYASNDIEGLRVISDGAPQYKAGGLGGMTVQGVPTIESALNLGDGEKAVVRVKVTFIGPGARPFRMTNEFDITVQYRQDGSLSKVIAWHPAGETPQSTNS